MLRLRTIEIDVHEGGLHCGKRCDYLRWVHSGQQPICLATFQDRLHRDDPLVLRSDDCIAQTLERSASLATDRAVDGEEP